MLFVVIVEIVTWYLVLMFATPTLRTEEAMDSAAMISFAVSKLA